MVFGYVRVPGIAKTRGRNANTQCFICKLRGTFSTSHFSEFFSDLRQFPLGIPDSPINKTESLLNIYIYIYPAMPAFTDQYSLPNIVFDIGQL